MSLHNFFDWNNKIQFYFYIHLPFSMIKDLTKFSASVQKYFPSEQPLIYLGVKPTQKNHSGT